MVGWNTKRGCKVTRTPEQILADLRNVRTDLNCTVDEARAVRAIQTMERIEERITLLADQVATAQEENERRWQFVFAYFRSRNSGDKQASAVYDSLVKDLERREGKK